MIKQYLLVGSQIDKKEVHITREYLKRVQNALEGWQMTDDNDSLPKFFLGTLGEHQKVYEKLDIKPTKQLHCRETIVTCRSVKLGDLIEIETVIADIYEQQASHNPLGFIVTDVWGRKNKSVLFHC
jgi:hypothetical protein